VGGRDGSARTLATGLLILLTAVWGSTFFLIRDVVATVPPADFLAVRFSVAALLMLAVFWRRLRALDRCEVLAAGGLGTLYGVAQLLQTAGLAHTDASVSGFITGTYVVLTPVLSALLLRERVPASTWYAVLLASAGLAVLSLRGVVVGVGEALTLAAAVLYALHIIGLGRLSTARRATGMSAVQMLAVAVLCDVAAVPDGLTWPSGTGQWASVLYMATAAGVFALWAQTWAQAHLSASRAAIVMTLEPVFAALFAILLGGESLTGRVLTGGALVVGAMYTVEVLGRRGSRRAPAEALHHEV